VIGSGHFQRLRRRPALAAVQTEPAKVPGASNNPEVGMTALPETPRERYLTAEEVQRLFLAAEGDRPDTAAVVKLLVLTGARLSEITKAKWEYIDWNKQTLLVARAKSGKPRVIALSTKVIDVLRAIGPADSGYIFRVFSVKPVSVILGCGSDSRQDCRTFGSTIYGILSPASSSTAARRSTSCRLSLAIATRA
jgi:integrase